MTERDERERQPEGEAEPPEADQPPISAAAAELARRLAGARAYIQTLPNTERRIATLAAEGQPIWAIAQTIGISEAAVSRTIDGVLVAIEGRALPRVETGGLGADTDPGVTGGYGDTEFGAIDTEPPAVNEEPDAQGRWPDEDEEEEA